MEPAYKKYFKREVNLLALTLIIYTLVSNIVVLGDYFVRGLLDSIYETPGTQQALETFDEGAVSMIIGVLIAFVVLYLMNRRVVSFRMIFHSNRPMTFTTFIRLLCVFSSFQLVLNGFDWLLEYCLNIFGLTAAESMESATASSETISMLIYACVIAPVFEELVYRGIAMRRLQFAGKKFAVILSAFLFGVMHANIPQAFFAFFAGLVLGYTAVEYSIFYAILIHFINNFVFGDLYSWFSDPLPASAGDMGYYLLFGVLTFCGVIVLIESRREIAAWLKENPAPKGAYRAAFTSALMIVFILMHFALSLLLISKLE